MRIGRFQGGRTGKLETLVLFIKQVVSKLFMFLKGDIISSLKVGCSLQTQS
jgi:hypothetical protein